MKIIHSLLICLVSAVASAAAFAEVVVITHPSNNNTFAKDELEALFMVKKSSFADGSKATVYYLSADDGNRHQFDEKVLGKSSSQLKAYWSKLVFTGKGTPPPELGNSAEAVAKVAAEPSAIAYVDKAAVKDGVKVVFTLP
jgi:ABC-type phosphate transport system substrate-binding protein